MEINEYKAEKIKACILFVCVFVFFVYVYDFVRSISVFSILSDSCAPNEWDSNLPLILKRWASTPSLRPFQSLGFQWRGDWLKCSWLEALACKTSKLESKSGNFNSTREKWIKVKFIWQGLSIWTLLNLMDYFKFDYESPLNAILTDQRRDEISLIGPNASWKDSAADISNNFTFNLIFASQSLPCMYGICRARGEHEWGCFS